MKILVQKFGGTSVVAAQQRQLAAQKVIQAKNDGFSPVVVVSAMGREGEPYATDTLIRLVKSVYQEVNHRELDLMMSCGEIISGVILTATFQSLGHDAVFLTGAQAGIVTTPQYGEARIQKVNPQRLMEELRKDRIVVVAGFQGNTSEGEITTLGRGGSDTTAAALGVALNAEFIDIFTDVEGIMTADPRIVDDARILDVVSYNEICQLAHEGAKVIHPRAVEIAMQRNIPIRIKSTFSDAPGTLITNRSLAGYGETDILNDRLITGITQTPNITQLKITTRNLSKPQGIELKIFKAMAGAGISIDFINVLPHAVLYTVKDAVSEKAARILKDLGLEPEVLPGCAKVSVVGANMAGIPGVMALIVEALTQEGISILQSADSHTTIWCLIRREDMERAVRALHQQFKLNEKIKTN